MRSNWQNDKLEQWIKQNAVRDEVQGRSSVVINKKIVSLFNRKKDTLKQWIMYRALKDVVLGSILDSNKHKGFLHA